MPEPTEVWRPVEGHPDYDVSNLGRVRSWRRCGKRAAEPHLLNPGPNWGGYAAVTLEDRSKQYVHTLVAAAFIGPRPPEHDVAHYDNNGLNNAVTNLRYDTATGNMADKIRHGTTNRGEQAGNLVLTAEKVREIRRRYGPYVRYRKGLETQRALGAEYGVPWAYIGSIVRHEVWRYDGLLEAS